MAYKDLIPETPTEELFAYLRDKAEKFRENILSFKAISRQDAEAAAFEEAFAGDFRSDRKKRAARCWCSGCGHLFLAEYIRARTCGGNGIPAGIRMVDAYVAGEEEVGDGGTIVCPCCGEPAELYGANRIRYTKTIRLERYKASVENFPFLRLGTWGSYGIETLKILPGEGWEGLTITATFVTPTTSTRMLVSEDGIVTVPPEATASVFTAGFPARIVFSGVADGVQRITTDLPYRVSDHAPIEGDAPTPTPSEWEQFVAQVQGAASDAKKSATEAADSASAAAGSATQAGQSAEKAAKSAQSAEETLEQVQTTGNSALQSIGAAKSDALSSIGTAQTTAVDSVQQTRQIAVQAVEQAGTTQVGAVNTAGQAQKTAIQQAGEDATQRVQDAGTEQVNAVNAAGDAKLQQIEEVNDLLPTPTEADAGKAPIAQPDGTYALQEVTVDAYTKTESDARYAPIEAAIKVSGKGTGLVSLSPTVGWYQQGLALYGRSWQDGTPSVEQEVPIQDAGQDGQIDVTVAGENLLPEQDVSSFYVNSVGTVIGYASGNAGKWMPVYAGITYYVRRANPGTRFRLATTTVKPSPIVGFTASVIDKSLGDTNSKLSIQSTVNGYLVINLDTAEGFDELMVSATGFEPYQSYTAQQLLIPTPDGLPGIPVTSGGDWTDENGQQWISDVVDLAAQEKTQYLKIRKITTEDNISFQPEQNRFYVAVGAKYNIGTTRSPVFGNVASTQAPISGTQDNQIFQYNDQLYWYAASQFSSVDELKTWLQSHDFYVLLRLATPITTPLDSATVASYRSLTTYTGTTNVLAPDCGIEAAAVAEPTQYIEDNIQAAITQAVAQAVALTGGNT